MVHVADGKVTVEKGTAKVGKAACDFSLESRSAADAQASPAVPGPRVYAPRPLPILPASHTVPAHDPDPLRELEDKLDRFDLTVRDLALDDDLFGRLPPLAAKLRKMFTPSGAVDLDVRFVRTAVGWTREVTARPNRLGIVYEKFRYPVSDVAGTVKHVTASDGVDEFRVDLTGTAGGRRVVAKGKVGATGQDPLVELHIAGTDVPIDKRLFDALPPKYAAALNRLRAAGRADFVAELRQAPGVNQLMNTVRVRVYNGAIKPDQFPYPLADVSGRVRVWVTAVAPDRPLRPGLPIEPVPDTDRVDLEGFEATHAGGKVWVAGQVAPAPGGRKLGLNLQGLNVPLDADLRAALGAVRLDETVTAFNPQGAITFGADLELLDRDAAAGRFDPVSDLALTLNFKGPTVTPGFFRYELADLAGVLRYKGGKVDLAKLTARHGASRVALDAAEVRFVPGGGVWANFGGLEVKPLVPDPALIAALPPGLRTGVGKLNLRGPMDLLVKQLVVQTTGEPDGGAGGVSPLLPQPAGTQVSYSGSNRGLTPPARPVARGQSPDDPGPVLFWNAELRLAGAALDAGLGWREVHGAVACVGRYDRDRLGTVVGNTWLDRAFLADHPVSAVKAAFRVRPQEIDPARPGQLTPPAVEFPDLTGTVYEGTVGGEARVVLGDAPQFRLWLTAAGVRLDALARELKLGSGAELRGLAQGRLLLENTPDPKTGAVALTGAGQVDVPSGRMYKLGVLLPMLKLLKLQAPDETAFEEAHATFELAGDRMKVTSLDLVGTAVSLGGSGELDTQTTDARFEFYTVWSQSLRRWLNTPFGDVGSFLSGNLFKIEVVRRDGRTAYTPHMVPAVTDPVRAVAERFRSRVLGPPDPAPLPDARAAGPR
ncbi:MAG: AsmA-like C-terminal region-containing protein [Gemmataceae bacterium]